MVLFLLIVLNWCFRLLNKICGGLCLMLWPSNVLRGYGLVCMSGGMRGVPARLQSVLSIVCGVPQLLLDRIAVACVSMDGMQWVSTHTYRILLWVHLVTRMSQHCLRLPWGLVSFLLLILTLLSWQTVPTFRPSLLLLFQKILVDLVRKLNFVVDRRVQSIFRRCVLVHRHELFWTDQVCFHWPAQHLVPGHLSLLVSYKLWMLVTLILYELTWLNCLVWLLDLMQWLSWCPLVSLQHPLLRLWLRLGSVRWFLDFYVTTNASIQSKIIGLIGIFRSSLSWVNWSILIIVGLDRTSFVAYAPSFGREILLFIGCRPSPHWRFVFLVFQNSRHPVYLTDLIVA